MSAGMEKVSQVDWCFTSKTAGAVLPTGRFSKPITWLRMPSRISPLRTASLSQPVHIQ